MSKNGALNTTELAARIKTATSTAVHIVGFKVPYVTSIAAAPLARVDVR